jgi:peptide/nickel transport system permease protein
MNRSRMRKALYRIGSRLLALALMTLAACLLSATLVRFAPGFGIDESEFNPNLSAASVESIRAAHRVDSLPAYYAHYVQRAVHGDFGNSQWLNQPIGALIKERFPITAKSVLIGVSLGWALAIALCLTGALVTNAVIEGAGAALSGILIALPAAAVAILSVYLRMPVAAAIAVVIFPKLYRFSWSLLKHSLQQPHIVAARARGLSEQWIVLRHVFPSAAPGLFALLGVSFSLAFGAAIPIEALCDSPGVGQLAWQAAINRDLPLMMTLTLVTTLLTVAANWLSSAANERMASL